MCTPWKDSYNKPSVLKSRNITFPAKVHLVKAVVFSVIMYGCESWTIKKAEHRRIDAFQLWTLESPLDCKEIKPVRPKGMNLKYSLEGLMLKLQYFGYLMQRANSLVKTLILGRIEGKRWRRWQRMRWLDGITESMYMNLSKLRKIVKDGKDWYYAVHGASQIWAWLSNWTTTTVS